VEHWRERDPIPQLRTLLINERGLSETELMAIENTCQLEVREAIEFALNSPEPAIEETYLNVYAEDK
jgi:pyruvate dehydrogenase E1 component alpha subunit